ncbi:T9SS type A sorting domain-containing protein [Brumimicrobium aurantiacum]|uniref:T9SS C-terminal target domain-containing protein n=1 Tax=Brumimicrobium aurantiacum TaxID=1737063 RepID=A0A3E1EUA7_9FLAO|nr:T9SS type A sorting domain-containing protein [Brumimicrobium aurantiacum]RFC53092.1 T9SS C-terminal target domain-containing protein [Brumimicrobium aurantiacum]
MKPGIRNTDMDIVDEMTLGFTGVAGFHLWNGRAEHTANYIELWKNTFRAQNHMNGDDVISTLSDNWGDWSHGMEKSKLFIVTLNDNVDAIEHQYYLSSNKEKAIGYVRNRTYNVHTKRVNSDCDLDFGDIEPIDDLENIKWNDNRLPINRRLDLVGLNSSEEYTIDYYSFRTGNYISTQCDETNNNGELRLKYPDLNTSINPLNPVIWYVVYQQNCNSSIVQQNNIEEYEEELNPTQILNNNINGEQVLNVYPNPFNNFISIQSIKKDQLILKSIEGKVIDNYKIDNGLTRVNTAALTSGMYILTFINQNRSFKLIKL